MTSNKQKETILNNAKMTDMEKLESIFCLEKAELKQQFPELYYVILAVIYGNKKPAPMSSFTE